VLSSKLDSNGRSPPQFQCERLNGIRDCLISRKVVDKMKTILPCALLIAGSGLMQAAIIESISLNL